MVQPAFNYVFPHTASSTAQPDQGIDTASSELPLFINIFFNATLSLHSPKPYWLLYKHDKQTTLTSSFLFL